MDILSVGFATDNAGHTIVANGVTYDFHLLPSGLINPECVNLIGSGVVVHVPAFFKELNDLKVKGLEVGENRLFISDRAHVVFDLHQLVDGLEEVELAKGGEKKAIGTTRKGIGVRKQKICLLDQNKLTPSCCSQHIRPKLPEAAFEYQRYSTSSSSMRNYGSWRVDIRRDMVTFWIMMLKGRSLDST